MSLIHIAYESTGDLLAQQTFVGRGGHDIKGIPITELDLEAIKRTVNEMRGVWSEN